MALQSRSAGHGGDMERVDFEDGKLNQSARCIGEMAEWLKAHAWKACLGETLTWVRIPVSPPLVLRNCLHFFDLQFKILIYSDIELIRVVSVCLCKSRQLRRVSRSCRSERPK